MHSNQTHKSFRICQTYVVVHEPLLSASWCLFLITFLLVRVCFAPWAGVILAGCAPNTSNFPLGPTRELLPSESVILSEKNKVFYYYHTNRHVSTTTIYLPTFDISDPFNTLRLCPVFTSGATSKLFTKVKKKEQISRKLKVL